MEKNSDAAIPRERRRSSDRKALLSGKKKMTVPDEQVPANYVPAAAVIRKGRTLLGITGRKGPVGGSISRLSKTHAQRGEGDRYCRARVEEGMMEYPV